MSIDRNYWRFVEKIVDIHVIWIKIFDMFRNINQRAIFIKIIDFFLVDKFLRFWRFKKFLLFLLSLSVLYLSNLLSQLSKHLRHDDLNNNDNHCLNEKIYIDDHSDEIRMKFYRLVVNDFLDENFSCIYWIEIEKIAIISKLNRNEFRICNRKVIECSRLVEWQTNLRLFFDKRIFEKRNFFDSKINRQKFQIIWRNFVLDNDRVKSSNNNFKNKSIDNSLEKKFDWLNWRDFDVTRLNLNSTFCRWKIERYYCVDNALYILR